MQRSYRPSKWREASHPVIAEGSLSATAFGAPAIGVATANGLPLTVTPERNL